MAEKGGNFDYALKIIKRQQSGLVVENFKGGIFETSEEMKDQIEKT